MSLISRDREERLTGHEFSLKILCDEIIEFDFLRSQILKSNLENSEKLNVLNILSKCIAKNAVFFIQRLNESLIAKELFDGKKKDSG